MDVQHRPRILVVEDNPGDAELVRTLLERNNVGPLEVVHCDCVTDAVSQLRADNFQTILLDLGLPDSQGLETLQSILTASRSTPIIVFTGRDDPAHSANMIRHGAQDYICKSTVSGELLVRTIRNSVERHRLLNDALRGSQTDELTGLYNRRGFAAMAKPLLKAADRLGASVVLLYLDLDGLKQINDSLGHKVGDRAIQETAEVLRDAFRDSDVLARLGGDEFAVLAVGAADSHCELLQQRLDKLVDERNACGDRQYSLSLSIGAVEIDLKSTEPLDALLKTADQRMYGQKRAKKAQRAAV